MSRLMYVLAIIVLTTFSFVNISFSDDDTRKIKPAEFAGISFGVGLSYTHDLGKSDRIKSAQVDENGIVRVDDEENDIARIMLESHYFFAPPGRFLWIEGLENEKDIIRWGWGPFIAVQPGSEEIIEAIGAGIMVGFKRDRGENEFSSWNIGIGGIVDPNVRTLGDGIEENKPLPEGETQIRYKEKSQAGLLVLASFTW